jgi:hypothetical protein
MSNSDRPKIIKLRIDEIKITSRHPRVRGTRERLQELADDIKQTCLLHLPVINPRKELVLGRRRLAAEELRGQEFVWCRIVEGFDDEVAALRAEMGENRYRVPLLVSEKVHLARQLRAAEEAAAKERQREGGKTAGRGRPKATGCGSLPQANREAGRSRDRVAETVGMNYRTLAQAEEVVAASEKDPGYAVLVEQMDRTKKVAPAHQELTQRPATGAGPPDPQPAGFRPVVRARRAGGDHRLVADQVHRLCETDFDAAAVVLALGIEAARKYAQDLTSLGNRGTELWQAIEADGGGAHA